MLPLEDAKKLLKKEITRFTKHLPLEQVPLWQAGGRVLAADLYAAEDVPFFDRSPIDGYALSAAETTAASLDNPLTFVVTDIIAAGRSETVKRPDHSTVKVLTGAAMPDNADCVVKQEYVTLVTSSDNKHGHIKLNRPLQVGDGVASKGEDIQKDELLIRKASVLTAAHIGILATLGVDPVTVYAKPRIGLFSTGNELLNTEQAATRGKLRASNLYTLAEMIRTAGGEAVNLGIVADIQTEVTAVYNRALDMNLTLVISTGGTASGDYDVTRGAMSDLGGERLLEKVAMRPGAPVVVTRTERQLIIGLSGNPAGASVAMMLLIAPLIASLSGTEYNLLQMNAQLTAPVQRKGGLRGFLWGNLSEKDSQLFVTPGANQFCGAIKTHASSNCLLEIPAGKTDLVVGDIVPIYFF